jgi:hypothetical protein
VWCASTGELGCAHPEIAAESPRCAAASKLGSVCTLQVHDGPVLAARDGDGDEALETIAQVMGKAVEAAAQLRVPVRVGPMQPANENRRIASGMRAHANAARPPASSTHLGRYLIIFDRQSL